MKKAMLSQPMAGKTEKEIVETRERAITALKERGYEIVNTLFTDEWYSNESMKDRGVVQIPLCFLAKSLENMAFSGFFHLPLSSVKFRQVRFLPLDSVFGIRKSNF